MVWMVGCLCYFLSPGPWFMIVLEMACTCRAFTPWNRLGTRDSRCQRACQKSSEECLKRLLCRTVGRARCTHSSRSPANHDRLRTCTPKTYLEERAGQSICLAALLFERVVEILTWSTSQGPSPYPAARHASFLPVGYWSLKDPLFG